MGILAHFPSFPRDILYESYNFHRILMDLPIDRWAVFCYDNAIQSERR